LNQLKRIEHIIAADMVYSYSEDELDELRTNIDNEQKIPDWLNDPEARAENIKYNGDLKKKY
jgi:nitrate reductase NapD